MSRSADREVVADLDIAIIGMSLRVPGANTLAGFWRNLRDGVESISFFSEEELRAAGVPLSLVNNPRYVRAGGILRDIELFDASFFGLYPRDAELLDPQQRFFLECSWEALEHAGYDPEKYDGVIGIYAGEGINAYLINNILANPELAEHLDPYQFIIQNDKDFLVSRVAYKLNLKGPSVVIQTACSTSLAAVHMACQSLLSYQCDLALAGGVTIRVPEKQGYLYHEGGILSPDGHCRAFDARAQGTVGGNGAGVVVLKRLTDAVAEGDTIHAVIKASALNNDGSAKVGYTAPGLDGQSQVIEAALALSAIAAESIGYVETHGTGTPMGDPIEIAALTQAFRASTAKKNFCAVGSVKTNIGHLDTAAGIAGLIKTVLALAHGLIPPSLHYQEPNPAIDFANSAFFVNAKLTEWKAGATPRRAGVSSFGIGGTNAHVILEEAPSVEVHPPSRPWQLLLLSARTSNALEVEIANLSEYLRQHPDIHLPDLAYTLQVGRKEFSYRHMLVCRDVAGARKALQSARASTNPSTLAEGKEPPVIFMFPGQGAQYPRMGMELYDSEPSFKKEIDLCAELLTTHLGFDLRSLLWANNPEGDDIVHELNQTVITQPALFVMEYALARLWMKWGVRPAALVGHSIGEYSAACIAGVFSLEDALALVAFRGRLMQELPVGAMLAVPLTPEQLWPLLDDSLSLAVVNAPSSCVAAGETAAVEQLERRLAREGVASRRVQASHAFHSAMMEPMIGAFTERVRQVSLQPPRIPVLSNLTGTWITAQQATDPHYWSRHLRQTVRFSENIQELLKLSDATWLEIGPGQTLQTMVRQHLQNPAERTISSSMAHPRQRRPGHLFLLEALGGQWLSGVKVDWRAFYADEQRRRIPAPTYPFERQRYWIDAPSAARDPTSRVNTQRSKKEVVGWFSTPLWKQTLKLPLKEYGGTPERKTYQLIFLDECNLGEELVQRLRSKGVEAVTVRAGKEFKKVAEQAYTVNPNSEGDYERLLDELRQINEQPTFIIHAWSVTAAKEANSDRALFEKALNLGFYSLLFLARSLGKKGMTHEVKICVLSNGIQAVTGEEQTVPEKATVLAPCKIISQEYPQINCRSIDLLLPPQGSKQREKLVEQLITELNAATSDRVIALRGKHRWVETFEPLRWNGSAQISSPLRRGGVYLITGGLGRLGLLLAEHLAGAVKAKLILVGRTELPTHDQWDHWLSTHQEGDDPVSQKIRKMQAIEGLGGEILIARADLADEEQMRTVINLAGERFGPINGIVHAAGLVGEQWLKTIDETDKLLCESHFHAKAYGLYVLGRLIDDRKIDFCLLFSSLSSVLGGLGYSAYAAANLFMDAFARQRDESSPGRWLSVNWDGWQAPDEKLSNTDAGTNVDGRITPEEGVEAFERVLSLVGSYPQVVVSTTDMSPRIEQWIKLERRLRAEPSRESGVAPSLHPRPTVSATYVEPRTELELSISAIWKEWLGIAEVGLDDNFFELGGDSLLATQLVSRLREVLSVELTLGSFFDSSTVGGLAVVVAELQTKQQDEQQAEILRTIEQLSDDEIEAELSLRV